jgi:hypothetical protein
MLLKINYLYGFVCVLVEKNLSNFNISLLCVYVVKIE